MKNHFLHFLLSVLLLSLALPALAADIEVRADRDPVPPGASFHLTFSAHGAVDDDPDFTPLQKDFDILRQGRSSQMNIVNGSFNRVSEWTLEVLPKRSGELPVPAIRFGADASPAITITVAAGGGGEAAEAGDGDLFLELEVTPHNPYVREQVLYTVRLLHAVEIAQASLSEPQGTEILAEKLGDDRHFRTRRGGRLYEAIERRYAIFPQKSGALTLAPIVFDGEVLGASRPGSPFDHFFPGAATTHRRLRSEAIPLEVRPIPAAFTGDRWLPAKSLILEQSWSTDPPQARVGEPLTRTLRLQAGGLAAKQLPDLAPAPPTGMKSYPDRPQLENGEGAAGLQGSRAEKIVLIPTQPGTLSLPALEIPWWNTETERMEIGRLPATQLEVLPAANGSAGTSLSPPVLVPPPADPVATPTAAPARQSSADPAPPAAPPWRGNLWFWLSLAGFAGWAVTAGAWWRSRKGKERGKTAIAGFTAGAQRPRLTPPEERLRRQRSAAGAGGAPGLG